MIINGFEVDAYWPGLCVEIDGPATGGRARRPTTGSRTRRCGPRATSVLRFTEDDVDFRPEKVLAQLAAQQLPARVAG